MTKLSFLDRVKVAHALWTFVVPETSQPPNGTLCRWLTVSTDEEVEKTILKIPNRFRDVEPNDEEVYRFVTSLLTIARKNRTRQEAA